MFVCFSRKYGNQRRGDLFDFLLNGIGNETGVKTTIESRALTRNHVRNQNIFIFNL